MCHSRVAWRRTTTLCARTTSGAWNGSGSATGAGTSSSRGPPRSCCAGWPAAPAVVADIGGGPGRYALWLASLGYQVEHRDLMPLHVEQLAADTAGVTGIHTAVGDVRDLDLPDASVDAVPLLGPLYHLLERAERVGALRECARSSGRAGRCSLPRSRGGPPGSTACSGSGST